MSVLYGDARVRRMQTDHSLEAVREGEGLPVLSPARRCRRWR
jgi:hypothetical protein